MCLKSFDTAIGLRNHMQWHEKPHEEGIDEIIRRKFAGTVSARMLVERVTSGPSPLAMGCFLRAPGHFCLP